MARSVGSPRRVEPYQCGWATAPTPPPAKLASLAAARHISACIFAAAVALMPAEGAAQHYSETVPYDPSLCATDPEGTVTIAFHRIVLRVPMDELSGIAGMSPEARAAAPVPPDTSQPEGCPDHPIIGRAFYFRYLQDAARNSDPPFGPLPRRVDRLALITADPDFWGLQFVWEELFERACERYELRDFLNAGLERCRVRPDDKEIPLEYWPFYLRAPLELYSTPFGHSFSAECTWGAVPGTHRCSVGYKLYDTLNISYRFEPGRLPIDGLIEFDRELRVWIDSLRVRDFVWPDEPDGNGDAL